MNPLFVLSGLNAPELLPEPGGTGHAETVFEGDAGFLQNVVAREQNRDLSAVPTRKFGRSVTKSPKDILKEKQALALATDEPSRGKR